ncbi:hypothetical protein Agub_g10933 [Astrephomene gubernaculifera]|uniref:Uncharacterized protein n=1 Tax=Astrephomene gubernaculifera TaxID=47775 RepID=A0AAD3DW27_9CHLO|nr:hypothetical protein Agub_g10933 [Astrephomene gubernaculifera]
MKEGLGWGRRKFTGMGTAAALARFFVLLIQLFRQSAYPRSPGTWRDAYGTMRYMALFLPSILTSTSFMAALAEVELGSALRISIHHMTVATPCFAQLLLAVLQPGTSRGPEWWLVPFASALLAVTNQDPTHITAIHASVLYTLSLATTAIDFAQQAGQAPVVPGSSALPGNLVAQLIHRALLLALMHALLAVSGPAADALRRLPVWPNRKLRGEESQEGGIELAKHEHDEHEQQHQQQEEQGQHSKDQQQERLWQLSLGWPGRGWAERWQVVAIRLLDAGLLVGCFFTAPDCGSSGTGMMGVGAAAAAAPGLPVQAVEARVVLSALRCLGALLVMSWGATAMVLNAIWVLWPRSARPDYACLVNSMASWISFLTRISLTVLLPGSGAPAAPAPCSNSSSAVVVGVGGSGNESYVRSSAVVAAATLLTLNLMASSLPPGWLGSQLAIAAGAAFCMHLLLESSSSSVAAVTMFYGSLWLVAVALSRLLTRSVNRQEGSRATRTPPVTHGSHVPQTAPEAAASAAAAAGAAAAAAAVAAVAASLSSMDESEAQAVFGPDASASCVHRLPPLVLAQALARSSLRRREVSGREEGFGAASSALFCSGSELAAAGSAGSRTLSRLGSTAAGIVGIASMLSSDVSDPRGDAHIGAANVINSSDVSPHVVAESCGVVGAPVLSLAPGRSLLRRSSIDTAFRQPVPHERRASLDVRLDPSRLRPSFRSVHRADAAVAELVSAPTLSPRLAGGGSSAAGSGDGTSTIGSPFLPPPPPPLTATATAASRLPPLAGGATRTAPYDRTSGIVTPRELQPSMRRAASEAAGGLTAAGVLLSGGSISATTPVAGSVAGISVRGSVAAAAAAPHHAAQRTASVPPPALTARKPIPPTEPAVQPPQSSSMVPDATAVVTSASATPAAGTTTTTATSINAPGNVNDATSVLSSTLLDADTYDRLLSSVSSPFVIGANPGARGGASAANTGSLPPPLSTAASMTVARRSVHGLQLNSSGLSESSYSPYNTETVGATVATAAATVAAGMAPPSCNGGGGAGASRLGAAVNAAAAAVAAAPSLLSGGVTAVPLASQPVTALTGPAAAPVVRVTPHDQGGEAAAGFSLSAGLKEIMLQASGGSGAAGRRVVEMRDGAVASLERLPNERQSENLRQVIVLADGRQVFRSEALAAVASSSPPNDLIAASAQRDTHETVTAQSERLPVHSSSLPQHVSTVSRLPASPSASPLRPRHRLLQQPPHSPRPYDLRPHQQQQQPLTRGSLLEATSAARVYAAGEVSLGPQTANATGLERRSRQDASPFSGPAAAAAVAASFGTTPNASRAFGGTARRGPHQQRRASLDAPSLSVRYPSRGAASAADVACGNAGSWTGDSWRSPSNLHAAMPYSDSDAVGFGAGSPQSSMPSPVSASRGRGTAPGGSTWPYSSTSYSGGAYSSAISNGGFTVVSGTSSATYATADTGGLSVAAAGVGVGAVAGSAGGGGGGNMTNRGGGNVLAPYNPRGSLDLGRHLHDTGLIRIGEDETLGGVCGESGSHHAHSSCTDTAGTGPSSASSGAGLVVRQSSARGSDGGGGAVSSIGGGGVVRSGSLTQRRGLPPPAVLPSGGRRAWPPLPYPTSATSTTLERGPPGMYDTGPSPSTAVATVSVLGGTRHALGLAPVGGEHNLDGTARFGSGGYAENGVAGCDAQDEAKRPHAVRALQPNRSPNRKVQNLFLGPQPLPPHLETAPGSGSGSSGSAGGGAATSVVRFVAGGGNGRRSSSVDAPRNSAGRILFGSNGGPVGPESLPVSDFTLQGLLNSHTGVSSSGGTLPPTGGSGGTAASASASAAGGTGGGGVMGVVLMGGIQGSSRQIASGGSGRSSNSNPSLMSLTDVTLGHMLPLPSAAAVASGNGNLSNAGALLTRGGTTVSSHSSNPGGAAAVLQARSTAGTTSHTRKGGSGGDTTSGSVATAGGGGGGGGTTAATSMVSSGQRIEGAQTLALMTGSGTASRGGLATAAVGMLALHGDMCSSGGGGASTSANGHHIACGAGSSSRLRFMSAGSGAGGGGGQSGSGALSARSGLRPSLPEVLATTAAVAAAAGGGSAPLPEANSFSLAKQASLLHFQQLQPVTHGSATAQHDAHSTSATGQRQQRSTATSRSSWFGSLMRRGSTAGTHYSIGVGMGIADSRRISCDAPAPAPLYGINGSTTSSVGGGVGSSNMHVSEEAHTQQLSRHLVDDTARLSPMLGMMHGLRRRLKRGIKSLSGKGGGEGASRLSSSGERLDPSK